MVLPIASRNVLVKPEAIIVATIVLLKNVLVSLKAVIHATIVLLKNVLVSLKAVIHAMIASLNVFVSAGALIVAKIAIAGDKNAGNQTVLTMIILNVYLMSLPL